MAAEPSTRGEECVGCVRQGAEYHTRPGKTKRHEAQEAHKIQFVAVALPGTLGASGLLGIWFQERSYFGTLSALSPPHFPHFPRLGVGEFRLAVHGPVTSEISDGFILPKVPGQFF